MLPLLCSYFREDERHLFRVLEVVVRTFTVARTNAELLEDSEGFGGLLHGAATSRRLILAVIIGTVVVRTLTVARTDTELFEDSEGFSGLLHGAMSRRLILTVIIGTVILVLFKHFR
ncbi:hypothetical protein HPB52_006718 [Rhipicephalus sanguineus]|uniref:Uncharacterized protein n=1 Tax=Rhipicephalus sanguineus TaxID=34632 RepID=A0A9D4SQW8_RHISA|nr:hypothetical protein HPB52_006718 [Rhipicephalus sanguineus]